MFIVTGAISADDLARYKANLDQPGALTAALNYYRAAVDAATWNPSPRTCATNYPTSTIHVLVK